MSSIDRKIDAWKNKLLDLGKRNRLLNYRDTKRSNLRILRPAFSEMWESFVLNEKPLEFPYYDDLGILSESDQETGLPQETFVVTNLSIQDQTKTLRNLRNKAKTVMEEQGVNVLYLTFGFLKWTQTEHSEYPLQSPIVLVPVSLSWESITSPFTLSMHEDEIVVNPTLTYKLENDFGITFPPFDTNQPVDGFLASIEELVAHNAWKVKREIGLSLFSFQKISMYKDMEQHRDAIMNNPIVRALCGDAAVIDRSAIDIADGYDHDHCELPIDIFQVVDADSSQQDAILCAKKGLSFILQGPPGTGKSQTITNIIAECLAVGKKVLFVSEKMAALEVVRRRLDMAGLGDFCLTLHSYKANKKEVLQQLRNTLDLASKKANLSDDAYQRLKMLQADRDQLNDYAEELFTSVQPLNKTLYEANGILANLNDYEDMIFSISDVAATTPEIMSSYIVALTRFAETIGKMSDDYKSNPWYGSNVVMVTNELRHDIAANTGSLIEKTRRLLAFADEMYKTLHLEYSMSYSSLAALMEVLSIAKNSPVVPANWIWMDDADFLPADLETCVSERNDYLAIRNELKRRYAKITAVEPNAKYLSAERLHSAADTENEISRLQQIITESSTFANWVKLPNADTLLPAFDEFRNKIHLINAKQEALLKTYESEILSIDFRRMFQRFKSEYTSVFKIFKSQYKADKKCIQGLHRDFVKKVKDDAILATLLTLIEIDEQRTWIEKNAERLRDMFGVYYSEMHTDFSSLEMAIKAFTEIQTCNRLLTQLSDIQKRHESKAASLRLKFDFEYAGIETDWVKVDQKVLWADSFRTAIISIR